VSSRHRDTLVSMLVFEVQHTCQFGSPGLWQEVSKSSIADVRRGFCGSNLPPELAWQLLHDEEQGLGSNVASAMLVDLAADSSSPRRGRQGGEPGPRCTHYRC
jgi:hypothetical protein